MYSLQTLVQHLIASTGIPTHIALDRSPEVRLTSTTSAFLLVAYDKIITPHEEDVLLDSASEAGNSIFCTTKVTLFARPEQYPQIWLAVYAACLHFQPEFPVPAHQPLAFTFLTSDFYEESGLWVSVSVWGYSFDRFWTSGDGSMCVPDAFNPVGLYNPATIMLP